MITLRIQRRPVGDPGPSKYVSRPCPPPLASFRVDELGVASPFIVKKHQNAVLGRLALDILELAAVSEFGARWITSDTFAYHVETGEDERGVEHVGTPGRSVGWYEKRGYRPYRVSRSFCFCRPRLVCDWPCTILASLPAQPWPKRLLITPSPLRQAGFGLTAPCLPPLFHHT